MKHIKSMSVLMILLLLLLVPSAALAADIGIGVQLNGDDVAFTDAAPVNENGRVYVPFRAVFEALDATVEYRAEDGQIMAEKDGVKVTFKVDQNTVTVDNGMPTDITIDAAPFIRDGRTYVPVRFAAQTLGLEVGWDGDAQTVVMLDKAELKKAAKGQYTLMDKYMKYAKMQKLTGPAKIVGDLKLEMQMANVADMSMVPVKGTVNVDGISSAEAANMNMAIVMDVTELTTALQQLDELTADDQAALDAMNQMNMQVIVDNKGGKSYVKSDIFALSGVDGNAWYMTDLSQTVGAAGMDLQAMMVSEAAAVNSYEEAILKMISNLSPENAANCDRMLAAMNMYRDDSFQRVGSNHISSMKYNMNGMNMSMSITVKTNGSAVTGYQEAAAMYLDNVPLMTMKSEQSGSKVAMDINLNMSGIFTMKVNGDLRYSSTSEKVVTAPPAGSVIQTLTV